MLLLEFENFPKEKALIGEMVIAYGEIEFAIATILGSIHGQDANIATRILFRVKGESPRLEVADAIIRPVMENSGLVGKWDCAYGAAKYCKNIRNQYTHCHWWAEKELLMFLNFDRMAEKRVGVLTTNFEPIDLPLIERQHQYFDYCTRLLYFLHTEYRRRVGISPIPDVSEPKSIPEPPRSNLKEILDRKSGSETT